MLEPWNAPAGRYFISYRSLADFRSVIGLPVIDEFATFSSPIFFCPRSLLGKIYNAGLSLAHKRDPEMGIDLGWPPLVVGYDGPVAELPTQWEQQLLEAIQKAGEKGSRGEGDAMQIDDYEIRRLRIGESEIFVTNVPLLPKQLRRVAQISNAPFSLAFSTANRLISQKNAVPLTVQIASETLLLKIISVLVLKTDILH